MLADLLRSSWQVSRCEGFEDWWRGSAATRARWADPVQRAVALGFEADRLAWAFAGGYSAALHALVPSLGDVPAALCATEDGGGHPRAMLATLEAGKVTGAKRFVSFGTFARVLLVVASEGQAAGRNRLRVVRVAADAAGVRVEPGVELPFVPEVPHASVVLEGAAGEVLAGDGYDEYLKPFRSMEDLHVSAAVAGYLLSASLRYGWPEAVTEQALGLVSLCLGVERAWSDPVTHLSLASVLTQLHGLAETVGPLWGTGVEAARFQRDLPLLHVGGKARGARRQTAWASLRPAVSGA